MEKRHFAKKDILWQDLDFYFNDQEELPFD